MRQEITARGFTLSSVWINCRNRKETI